MSEKLPIVKSNMDLPVMPEVQPQDYIDTIAETLDRMKAEQPELISHMESFIQGAAVDSADAARMIDAMVMTYRMLQVQAEVGMKEEVRGVEHTSLGTSGDKPEWRFYDTGIDPRSISHAFEGEEEDGSF